MSHEAGQARHFQSDFNIQQPILNIQYEETEAGGMRLALTVRP
jgi:hypothetical protein